MKDRFLKALLILLLFFSTKLNATDLQFTCQYKNVFTQATGVYVCNPAGRIFYTTTSGTQIDILNLSPFPIKKENLKIQENKAARSVYDFYGNNFCSFDSDGNFYFIGSLSYIEFDSPDSYINYSTVNMLCLYKFNPVFLSVTCIPLKSDCIPHNFCLSKNGKWAFVDILENADESFQTGKPAIYAIDTDAKQDVQKLYFSEELKKPVESNIKGLCFDNNLNNLYYLLSGENSNDCSLVEVKPDSRGNYLKINSNKENPVDQKLSKLYANKDGLWATTKKENKSSTVSLIHLQDRKGSPVSKQKKEISTLQISENRLFNPGILVEDDYILCLTEDASKIIEISNNKTRDVSTLAAEKNIFSKDDLTEVSRILHEQKDIKEKPVDISRSFFFISICLLISLVVIIIFLILWILHLTNKSNQIKKDKKFIFQIQETERGKISRDIHDSIIQDIRSIRLKTEMLKVDSESEETKKDVIKLSTDCVVKLRNICYNLTPAELSTHKDGDSTEIELVSIIQSLVVQFIERTHVPCQLKIDSNFEYPVLEKETSQNLFRIIQEALANIEKHSYATECQILIRNKNTAEKKGILIVISDDGAGCDIKALRIHRRRTHFGLRNILERAYLIGATVEFESEPGHGFEVTISL